MPVRKDITGQRFGRLVTIQYLGHRRYLCKCDCGTVKEVATRSMTEGLVKSCGCIWREWSASKPSTESGRPRHS